MDDRPCNTTFPALLARVAGAEMRVSENDPRLQSALAGSEIAVLSVERFVFGGLVESRDPESPAAEAATRAAELGKILKAAKHGNVYAFTVLMRQAPTAFTPEWERNAELIRQASIEADGGAPSDEILNRIPDGVWRAYLDARKRNLGVNLAAVGWTLDGNIRFLAVAMDDLAQRGLNRLEKEDLERLVARQKLSGRVMVLPGADEMGALLLAKSLLEKSGSSLKIFTHYSHPAPDKFALRYEDCALSEIVAHQISLLGCQVAGSEAEADFLLFAHAPQEDQLDIPPQSEPRCDARWLDTLADRVANGKLCALADLRYANGADAALMRRAAERLDLSRLLAYSAWNTTANALGFALAHGALRASALRRNEPLTADQESAHKEFLFLRLVEDWLYEAEIRPPLLAKLRARGLSTLRLDDMTARAAAAETRDELRKLLASARLPFPFEVDRVEFPWKRPFEVSITFSPKK